MTFLKDGKEPPARLRPSRSQAGRRCDPDGAGTLSATVGEETDGTDQRRAERTAAGPWTLDHSPTYGSSAMKRARLMAALAAR